jgi:outer membrane protein with beta-barrel domain
MTNALLSSTAAVALVLALPVTAAAQSTPNGASTCAPGSWFCAEAPEPQAPPAAKPVQRLEPLPDPDEEAPAPTDDTPPPRPARRPHRIPPPPPPPGYVYPSAPPPSAFPPPEGPPSEYAPIVREPLSRPREWGLALRVEGALIGHGAGNAGMGGAGVGLRYKPNRRFGVEADLDIVGGTDYQDDHRTETAFAFNGLFFLNPKSPAQLYVLAGFGWSGAHVTCDSGTSCAAASAEPIDRQYTYFGGQIGGGLELRLSRVIALNADVRGFIRTRIDGQAASEPEFVDANGRTTNTSGGGLVSGGMVLYF